MKRIISLLLTVALLFSLCALASCGKDEEAKSATSSKSQSKNTSSTTSKNVSSDVSSADISSDVSSANTSVDVSSSVSSDKTSSTVSSKVNSVNTSSTVSEPTPPSALALPEYTKNSGTIKIYSSLMGYENNQWWNEFLGYFKEQCNGIVVINHVSWDGWENKYITDFAAADAPDLIYLFEKNWPKLANRGMVYSVKDLKNKGVLGLDHPYLVEKHDSVKSIFNLKGEGYSFATKTAEPIMMFVNEDLFKKYGVKSPSSYYKDGTWNWENFEKCSKQLTRDINDDDIFDIHGYSGWDANWIVTAAGGSLISVQKDGTLAVTMDSKAAVQGFNNIHKIYGTLKCAVNTTGQEEFAKGNLGMMAYMPRNMYNYLFGLNKTDKFSFNWSMVPFPIDTRTNKTNTCSGSVYAWAVNSVSKNPQGCINYVIAYETYSKTKPNPKDVHLENYFSADQMKMINSCTKQLNIPIYQGVGTLWNAQWDFWNQLRKAKATVNETVAKFKPMFEQQVELENSLATH